MKTTPVAEAKIRCRVATGTAGEVRRFLVSSLDAYAKFPVAGFGLSAISDDELSVRMPLAGYGHHSSEHTNPEILTARVNYASD